MKQQQNKTHLRTTLIKKRHSLNPEELEHNSQKIANLLFQRPEFIKARNIASYWAINNEVLTATIHEKCWSLHKNLYLPKISPSSEMQFHHYTTTGELVKNQYGIPEPNSNDKLAATELDLVLVPLVGFDLFGNRIGMGAGFYDRTFAFLNSNHSQGKPILFGLAHAFQQVICTHKSQFDVKLSLIITEFDIKIPKER